MDDFLDSPDWKRRRAENNIEEETENMGEGSKKPSLLVFILIAACIAICIVTSVYLYTSSAKYEYHTEWQRSTDNADGSIDTFRGYKGFAGGIIKYTRDGAEYIDKKGEVIWERSYEMDAPVIDVSSSYAVIADQGSAGIYIFNTQTLTGQSETLLPISLVRISDGGVVYAVQNDSDADYITAFRPDGSTIDLSVKSVVSGEGYPFDLDTSPDGTQLITSYIGIENGALVNNVVFRNFGTVGQNEDSRRIVGGFKDEFDGHIAGRVHFATDEYSQAFYDGGVVFFSTKVLNTPEVLGNISFDQRMMAIDYNEQLSAVLLENDNDGTSGSDADGSDSESEPDARYTLMIYNTRGSCTGETQVYTGCKGMCVNGSSVIIYDSSNITVYSSRGKIRASLQYDDAEITAIIGSDKSSAFYIITAADVTRVGY